MQYACNTDNHSPQTHYHSTGTYVRGIRLNALSIHSTKRDKARESHTTERASGGSSHVTSANAELSLLRQQLGPQGRHWLSLQEPSKTDTEAVVAHSLLPGIPPLPLFLESDSIQATTTVLHNPQPHLQQRLPDTSTGHKYWTQLEYSLFICTYFHMHAQHA